MKRTHKHAEMIKAWLDDASLEVECRTEIGNWFYEPDPSWCENLQYRFKLKMIKCGEHEFPEPMQVAPELNTVYWVASISTSAISYQHLWISDKQDRENLARGVTHSTKAAAEAHARALISLTEIKE